jgi:hypothetical protein
MAEESWTAAEKRTVKVIGGCKPNIRLHFCDTGDDEGKD